MNLEIQHSEQVAIVQVICDRLEFNNVKPFREQIAELLQQQSQVVLDMTALRYVDSAGLGALLCCLRTATDQSGDFRLCGLNRPVRALFDLMRLHRVFKVYNSCDEAVRSFH